MCMIVTFVTHGRTRNCNNPTLLLKIPSCKTATFKAAYCNGINITFHLSITFLTGGLNDNML